MSDDPLLPGGGEEDPATPKPNFRNVRIVDGVSSTGTYAVLATHGEHRLAIRWLFFKPGPEKNRSGAIKPDGKQVMNAVFKVHVEKDGRKRIEIGERTFNKFGLPEVFAHKIDRFTGIVEVPLCYYPNPAEKLVNGLMETPLPEMLWQTVLQPAVDHGAEMDVDKRAFAKWVKAQINPDLLKEYGSSDGTKTRGEPVQRAFWQDYAGHEGDDDPMPSADFDLDPQDDD